ncbi:MAG: 50S ribosomal protein L21 [Candidatus Calescibacterium sp.]|nr:50S ribosomal protein L21 [Candidatus Calescibacterium sp.]MCX7971854.1 50S ribosomal protein L21 [bacterium]MDW8195047.1 50S ribosomal protein L21 [Candidatus Calescibacterium sp.]
MFAIVEIKGHQYKVQNGQIITTEKIEEEPGKEIEIKNVLLLYDGKELKIGKPYLEINIKAKILRHFKGQKIIDFKYTPKKRYRRKRGHRQQLTELQIFL